ncbi:MAG: hypothetical protein HC919_00215 [Oscillatoriales cyanobacterium SM2_2_1]|nr:hypothetical protein [Oscillatoriales cyanobacterium SM2_2_1]
MTRQALSDGTFELFILDELDRAIARHLITEAELLSSLDARSERVEVILTGTAMPQNLLEQADQVTHYRNFKGCAGESKLGATPPA